MVGRAQSRAISRKQVEEGWGSLRWVPGECHAWTEGTVGWTVDNPTAVLADGTEVPVRITYVFHREPDGWRIVHNHGSVGVDTEETFAMRLTTSLDAIAELIDRERPDVTPIAVLDGTVTMVFTDIESSTALNEALGDTHWVEVIAAHNTMVTRCTQEHGGVVIKRVGDGFMLAFGSARRAVDCAVAIQQTLGPGSPLRVRIGVHTGEPIRQADDFFGRDVAYAARVAAVAQGGEIVVSSVVKAIVAASGVFVFEPRDVDLKGFEGSQHVFAVSSTGEVPP